MNLPELRHLPPAASPPAGSRAGTPDRRFSQRSATLTRPGRFPTRASGSRFSSRVGADPRTVPNAAHYSLYNAPSCCIIRGAVVVVKEITDAGALATVEPAWSDLLARAADPTPFQSPEWQATWWKHHGRGRLWVLAA